MQRLLRDPAGALGFSILCVVTALALLGPVSVPRDPYEVNLGRKLEAPSREYLLGTDEYGRDLLSRVIVGARISLGVALRAVVLAILMGVPAGLVSAYYGGLPDAVIMRLADIVLSFPSILVGMVMVSALTPSSMNIAYAIAIVNVPRFVRMARASTLAEKGKEYVMGAVAIGASGRRIMFGHLLPNALPPLLVQTAVSMSHAILLEAAFSFLGLGAQPPEPSWGSMLQHARQYMNYSTWYSLFPGLAITTVVLAMNLFAAALQDALRPVKR